MVGVVVSQAASAEPVPDKQSLPTGALVRLGSVNYRNQGISPPIAYSPDGKLMAFGIDAKDNETIARLIARLDDEDFAARESATVELTRLGWRAEPALRLALEDKSPEVRRRAEGLLKGILSKERGEDLEVVQLVRALEVLERISTPDAIKVIEELAKGPPSLRLTVEASMMRQRLARKP
jgi:HEAT repeat protein